MSKSPDTGLYDAHFGLILTDNPVCHRGYEGTDTRPPQDGSNRPLNTKAGCTEPPTQSNPRGSQNLPRPAASYGTPVVRRTTRTRAGCAGCDRSTRARPARGVAAPISFGEDSWKWLFLQPLTEIRP